MYNYWLVGKQMAHVAMVTAAKMLCMDPLIPDKMNRRVCYNS